mgnify:CR=1 FL=1
MENTLNLDFDSILKSVNPDAVVEQKEEVTMENMVIEGQEAEEKEEQQQEEEVKPVVEVKEEDKPVEPQTTTNNFASLAKTLLENGKWQDGVIVDKDGNEVALSEMESLDEETFLQIQENQDQEYKKSYEEGFLSIKDADDRQKQVAEIVLKGGDLEEIFGSKQNVENYLNPFKGVDLDNEKVQENIYYNHLKAKGYSDKAALFELDEKKKELVLDTEVSKIVEDTNKKAQDYVASKQKELEDKQKDTLKQEKEYKKNLSKVLKDKELKDATVKKYVDLATKRTNEGEYAIDTLYNDMMQDPEKAVDLIAFLSDKENFLKEYQSKAKTEVTKKVLIDLRKVKPQEKTPVKQEKQEGFDIPMAE